MRTYEIIEAGYHFDTRRARSAESAIKAARRGVRINASDYDARRGEMVELEWTARATDDSGDVATLTMRARAR